MSPKPSRSYPERGSSPEPTVEPQPTISQLISDLRHETTELFRKEVQLARIEIADAVTRLTTGVSVSAAGGVVAFAGLLVLLAAAAFGLDTVLRMPWLSALIVGTATVLIGAVGVVIGRAKLARLTPERSLRSLQRDRELVQEHLPGGGS